MPAWDRRLLLVLGAVLLAAPRASVAFDAQGHVVIEALAYRSDTRPTAIFPVSA
jgi:hypothetical protein